MGKIKLELAQRNIENKIQFGIEVDSAMSNAGGGATFTGLSAGQTAMATSKGTLQTKWTEYNGALQLAQQKYTELQSAEADFDRDMTKLANEVENLADGNVSIIQSAAMDVKAPKSPPQIPEQVLNLKVEEGDSAGTMKLSWKNVKGAKSYNIEITTDVNSPTSWAFKVSSTKSKIVINTLTSGMKYWFRVYAVGSAGNGAPSDPAVKYAP